jgi:hypothetical protein
VPPRVEPSELKKPPELREALARAAEKFGGDAESAREKIGVRAISAAEALQRGHLALTRGVGEIELVLRAPVRLRNSLLARELVFEIAEASSVVGACDAILRGLLQRIESAR